MAANFFVVPTATCRLLFVLIIIAHERRRVAHVAVTDHPTAAWTAQQLREAFPWEDAPRYLLRDRDHAFDGWAETAKTMRIDELLTAPRAPWQNTYAERFIGSARRECLDHVIVFSATGLQRLMKRYCAYYERSRTHLSLNKDAPIHRPIVAAADGRVVAIPQVGGHPPTSAAFITGTNGAQPDLAGSKRDLKTGVARDGREPAGQGLLAMSNIEPKRSVQPNRPRSARLAAQRNSARRSFW